MKTFTTIVLLAMLQSAAYAQESNPSESSIDDPIPAATEEATKEGETEARSAETDLDDWKPKFKVMLLLNEDGTAKTGTRKQNVTTTRYVEKQQTVMDLQRRSFVMSVKTPEVQHREVEVPYFVAGKSVLLCDQISITTAVDGAQTGYAFEAKGKCALFVSAMQIVAESMKLEDGELTITDATITQQETLVKSATMTIPLKIFGISTQNCNKLFSEALGFDVKPGFGSLFASEIIYSGSSEPYSNERRRPQAPMFERQQDDRRDAFPRSFDDAPDFGAVNQKPSDTFRDPEGDRKFDRRSSFEAK